jgi:hypothetical protein
VVESDDEAGEDVDPMGVDRAHRGEKVLPGVLKLERLLEARWVRRLDSDEHPAEVGRPEQLEQLRVLGQVDRGLRSELEPIPVLALVRGQEPQQLLGGGFVADEVVIHEEDAADALLPQRVQFPSDLRGRFGARLPPEHDDDVAELAAERAAARKLQAHRPVLGQVQEIEAGNR